MTKRERAQAIELLRCAADFDGEYDTVGMVMAAWSLDLVDFINPCKKAYAIADNALAAVEPSARRGGYRFWLLEAATRLEVGAP